MIVSSGEEEILAWRNKNKRVTRSVVGMNGMGGVRYVRLFVSFLTKIWVGMERVTRTGMEMYALKQQQEMEE